MISQEAIIIFVATLLVTALVISALYTQVQDAANRAGSVGAQVQGSVSKDYVIVSVEGNYIYVRGVSGELNVAGASILLNGIPQTYTYTFLRDRGSNNLLDPNDLVLFQIGAEVNDGDCLLIDIDGVSTPWGGC